MHEGTADFDDVTAASQLPLAVLRPQWVQTMSGAYGCNLSKLNAHAVDAGDLQMTGRRDLQLEEELLPRSRVMVQPMEPDNDK